MTLYVIVQKDDVVKLYASESLIPNRGRDDWLRFVYNICFSSEHSEDQARQSWQKSKLRVDEAKGR